MRQILIITLKILRVLLIIIFLSVIILWILSAFLDWDLGYLEPLSILILAPFSAAGAWLSNLGTKKLKEPIDQSTTIVNTDRR